MGMVWVPLLDVVIADVDDHEVGSASGVLQAVQQLGMSLGIAAIGTMFFGMVGAGAGGTGDFVDAAQTTTLVAVGLVAAAFAIAFLLPRRGPRAARAGRRRLVGRTPSRRSPELRSRRAGLSPAPPTAGRARVFARAVVRRGREPSPSPR